MSRTMARSRNLLGSTPSMRQLSRQARRVASMYPIVRRVKYAGKSMGPRWKVGCIPWDS